MEEARRGSHATTYGQGFSWVMLWTIMGAVIPGSGLIAAGWRRLGGLLLFLLGFGALALVALALVGDPVKRATSLAVDPQKLLILAMVVAVIALAWVGVVVLTSSQLRRYANLTPGQGIFCWIVVLALVVGVGLPAYKVSSSVLIARGLVSSDTLFGGDADTAGGPDAKKADPWANKPRMNVLLIGSDAGADRTGIRPDTMIVASIDTKSGNTVLFSLPRNLERAPFAEGSPGAASWPNGFYCPNQGSGHDCLLNAVWTWAESSPGYKRFKRPGLRGTEDAIQGVTGLKIDTYVMLNLNGFRDFVDAVGGITVDVHERLPIGGNGDPSSPLYHRAVGGYIEKGNHQHLDGYHALWFARSRWSSDDFHRMRRQRCVIGAVVSQSDPVKLALSFPKIAKALKKNLSTGIAQDDLEAWVDLAQRIKSANVASLPFDDKVVPDRGNPDFDQIHTLVTQALAASVKPKVAPTPSASASPGTKVKKKKLNPEKAQNIKDVC